MDTDAARLLARIVLTQRVAALGTIHDDEPYVSMVPYALLPSGDAFIVHVSTLAAHTRDMLEHPAVSLLVMAPLENGTSAQALPRITVQATAHACDDTDPGYADARAAYLGRFPESADMFRFADFSLFAIVPRRARFVGGFAQARSLTGATLSAILRGAAS